jgi:hypothetical protein
LLERLIRVDAVVSGAGETEQRSRNLFVAEHLGVSGTGNSVLRVVALVDLVSGVGTLSADVLLRTGSYLTG